MRVSEFNDFDSFETEGLLTGGKERSWLWFGLIVSLGIHLALCAYFYRTRFQSAEVAMVRNEQTPTFKVRSVDGSNLEKSSVDDTNQAARSQRLVEPSLPRVPRLSGPIPLPVKCLAIAPARTKGTLPASAIWISCSPKKVRSGQAQNCECRTTSFSNMTATCCKEAPS